MSQSSILSLASTAAVAIATLAAQPADAGFRPIMGHLPAFGPVGHAGPPIHIPIAAGPSHPIVPIHVPIGPVHIPPLNPGHPLGPIHLPPIPVNHPPIPLPPPPLPPVVDHHHHHHHWVFRDGHWIMLDEVVEEAPIASVPEAVSTSGPCTCLTKTYTPSGLVVFADVCTKESASAPVDGTVGDATQTPTSPVAATAVPMSAVPTSPNYAGRTYEDYLAANPQAANPPAPKGSDKN